MWELKKLQLRIPLFVGNWLRIWMHYDGFCIGSYPQKMEAFPSKLDLVETPLKNSFQWKSLWNIEKSFCRNTVQMSENILDREKCLDIEREGDGVLHICLKFQRFEIV